MKRLFLLLVIISLFNSIHAQTNHLVISQVYAAGGNSNALFTNDFVELFNPTTSTVSLSGLSLQYAAVSAASWNKLNLSGSISAGHYFLVQLSSGGVNGVALPAPDQTASFGLGTTGGIVSLINGTTATTSNTCPANAIDLVGYGSSPTCKEGSAASAPNATSAIFRLNNGCTDADNNATDFELLTVSPRNHSSDPHSCLNGSITVTSVTSLPFCVNGLTGTSGSLHYSTTGNFSNSVFNVYLSDVNGSFTAASLVGTAVVNGTDPSGTIAINIPATTSSGSNYVVRIIAQTPSVYSSMSNAVEIINGAKNVSQLTAISGSGKLACSWTNPAGCYDEIMLVVKHNASITASPAGDGSAYTASADFYGSGTSFDGGKVVYKGSGTSVAITGLANNETYYVKAFTRRETQWSSGIEVSEFPRNQPEPGEILINQLSSDYAAASDEYVELVNTTNKTFYLSDLAFAYQSSTGGSKLSQFLSGILKPHSFWLLSTNATVTVGKTSALARDGSIINSLAGAGGQIAIVRKWDNSIIDAVAYGTVTAGNYIEGSPATVAPADGGLKRITDGSDNNTNNTDFTTVDNSDIDLRNSTSILANENAVIDAGTYSRLYITGNASLAGAVIVNEKAVLINNKLSLFNYDLTASAIQGGSTSCYIKTNSTGALTVKGVATTAVTFPVGNSTYNPLTIANGGGLDWKVKVEDVATGVNNNKSVLRWWDITPAITPSSGANLSFEYNDGDVTQLGSNFNKTTSVQVWSNHNNTWQAVGLAVDPTGPTGGTRTVSLNNWTEFSTFSIANIVGALPVRFANEKVVLNTNAVTLSWTNLTEDKVLNYEVQRSTDGVSFDFLAQVKPKRNNASATDYTYVDASQFSGKLYYRIKAQEIDGTITYSKIVALDTGERLPRLLVFPNPAKAGQVSIHTKNLPSGKYSIQVFNAGGQLLLKDELQHSKGSVEKPSLLNQLKPGHYLLNLKGVVSIYQWFVVE